MRLASAPHVVPPELASELAKVGIITSSDLLFREKPLDLYQKLPQGTIALRELRALILRVAKLCAAPESPLTSHTSVLLPSGLPCFDTITNFFDEAPISEIAGDANSGKTTVALNIALRLLHKDPTSSVLWMDTTGDFSPKRATALQETMGFMDTDMLDRLHVSPAMELDAVYGVLWSLQNNPMTLIVIDNIASILGSYFSASSCQGQAIMTGFMRQLRQTARTSGSKIIVINNASLIRNGLSPSIFPGTTKKPALGPTFTFMCDCTVWLTKKNESAHIAEILHARSVVSLYSYPLLQLTFRSLPTYGAPSRSSAVAS